MRKNAIVHVPDGGQCGTLITQPSRARHYVLLPTKTSRLWTQIWGMSAVCLRAGSQVSLLDGGILVSLNLGDYYLVFSESCINCPEPSGADFSVCMYMFFV